MDLFLTIFVLAYLKAAGADINSFDAHGLVTSLSG